MHLKFPAIAMKSQRYSHCLQGEWAETFHSDILWTNQCGWMLFGIVRFLPEYAICRS